MLILTTKSFCLEKLTLTNPFSSGGVMYCGISNDSDPLYLQTPRLLFDSSGEDLRIFFDNEKKTEDVNVFYGMVRDIEDSLCENLSLHSGDWFSGDIPLGVIKDNLFKTSIKLPSRISESLSLLSRVPVLPGGGKDVEVFDASRTPREYSELGSVKEATFLLHAKELVITSTQASISWELVQVLVHKKKKKVKGFGIRTDAEDPPEKINIGFIATQPTEVPVTQIVEVPEEKVEIVSEIVPEIVSEIVSEIVLQD
jgi:hypothetical protein